MYWLLFVILLLSFFLCYASQRQWKSLYYLSFALMTAMLCLRFGQGTDYPNYQYLYRFPAHGEWGYRTLTIFLRDHGVSFQTFIFFLSLFLCLLTHKAIVRYSPHRTFSLFLLYPTIYLTYYASGLRQGIVIAVFLAWLMPLLEKKQRLFYVLACLILSLFHTVALALIPLVLIDLFKVRHLLWISLFALVIGVMNQIFPFGVTLANQLSDFLALERDFESTEVYALAFLERVITCFLVVFIFAAQSERDDLNAAQSLLFKIYLFGFITFMIFSSNAMLSSRFCIVFKAVEILLLPAIVDRQIRIRHVFVAIVCILSFVMTWKNIGSYIVQGRYYPGTTRLNYPYISIFNKREILKYRPYDLHSLE
ncbi:MAG: EpsG family protein [Myxococcaceae bacterium]|nr:EpsG family protein [Myxococcaceae bacterium]